MKEKMGKLLVIFSMLIWHVSAGEKLPVSQGLVLDGQIDSLIVEEKSQNVENQEFLLQLSADILDTKKDAKYLIKTYSFLNEQPDVAKAWFTEDRLLGLIAFLDTEFQDILNEFDKLQRYQRYLGICGSLIAVAEMLSLYYLVDGNLVLAVGSVIGIIFPALELSKNISIDQYALGHKRKKVVLPLFHELGINKDEKYLSISAIIHAIIQYQALIKHFNPQG